MGGNNPLVKSCLPEQQRLNEPLYSHQWMPVGQNAAELQGAQHVALDIKVTPEERLCDPSLVEAGESAHRTAGSEHKTKGARPIPQLPPCPVRQYQVESSR